MKSFSKLAISILTCELAGIISTPFTVAAIPNWYAYLNKPAFSPPSWVFGPAWAILYFLMGVSAFLVWQKGLNTKKVKEALLYFFIQLFLNFLWSFLFFGQHSTVLGLLDIVALIISIILTIASFYKISRVAAYFLIPYLLWVSFAGILNLSIVVLNR